MAAPASNGSAPIRAPNDSSDFTVGSACPRRRLADSECAAIVGLTVTPRRRSALYGVVPTLQPKSADFGHVYAAYGGVLIALSILWGWWIDKIIPDRPDIIGGTIALAGASIVMYWPRVLQLQANVETFLNEPLRDNSRRSGERR